MSRKDILLKDFDLAFENGDFEAGPSDQQHIEAIFIAHPGSFKEWPLLGFGANKNLNKRKLSTAEFMRDMKVQLSYDGYEDPEIDLKKGIDKLTIKI